MIVLFELAYVVECYSYSITELKISYALVLGNRSSGTWHG